VQGVRVGHHTVLSMVAHATTVFLPELSHDSSLLVTAGVASGEMMMSIFSTLRYGACLCLASTDSLLENPCLLLNQLEVSHLYTTPAFLSTLATSETPHSLRVVSVSPGSLQQSTVDHWRQRVRLITVYGAAEVGTTNIVYDHSQNLHAHSSALIGRPAPSVVTYILDQLMQPVPVGSIGKLYISIVHGCGHGHKTPRTKNSYFVDDPFRKGRSMWNTGDYAHFLADGTIWFHGPCDRQLILGPGHLFEWHEIEAALLDTGSVSSVAVVVVAESITAFVTPDCVDVEMLHNHYASVLPRYLVPSRIVPLKKLPLTSLWRADRDALIAMCMEDVSKYDGTGEIED